MAIVRDREVKQVKRDLKNTELKIKDTKQEIEQLTEQISEAEETIIELSVQKDADLAKLEKKMEGAKGLQEQYLSLKQKLDYMTGAEETVAPWEKDRPSSERSLFAFAEGLS